MLNQNVKKLASVRGLWNREQKICHSLRVFHHKIHGNFYKHSNQAHNRKRVKGVAKRAKHEILATAVEFCEMGCSVSRDICWKVVGSFQLS